MEKKLLQQIIDNYKNQIDFTFVDEEAHLITEYIGRGFLREKAFFKIVSIGPSKPEYIQETGEYPLTPAGEELLNQSDVTHAVEKQPNQSRFTKLLGKIIKHPVTTAIVIVATLLLAFLAIF